MRILLILLLAGGSAWLLRDRANLKDQVADLTRRLEANGQSPNGRNWVLERLANRTDPFKVPPRISARASSRTLVNPYPSAFAGLE